jgi:DNA phosphorothioation-dependent restriction protein DptH
MNYFAESAWDYVARKIESAQVAGNVWRLLITIPRFPEATTLALGDTFKSRCEAANLALTFKVADAVSRAWSERGKEIAAGHDWLDRYGTLTHWRHSPPADSGRPNLIVLCGADVVTDAGSLSDFHSCDLAAVWCEQLKSSFQGWIAKKLNAVGIVYDGIDLREFDRLMVPLVDHGKADLLSVGDWLAKLDLASASSVRDVQKVMLSQLGTFHLPKFSGFPLGRKRASLGPYIEKAGSFFSYTMFLDAREREKAIKAIDNIEEVMDTEGDTGVSLDAPDLLGPYVHAKALLEGLRNYIENEDRHHRAQLMACDFVTIIDKILKFRKERTEAKEKEATRNLSGSPVEVVLHAVWQTLREFGRAKEWSDTEVERIDIVASRFRHDYESSPDDEEAGAAIDLAGLARRYLSRLLGGLDGLVNAHLTLPRASGENVEVGCRLVGDDVTCVYAKTAEPQLEFSVQLKPAGGVATFRRKFAWRLPEIQSYRIAEAMIRWAREAMDKESSTRTLPVFHLRYHDELLRAADDEETRRILLHSLREAAPDETNLSNLLSREWLDSRDTLLPNVIPLAEKYALFLRAGSDRGLHSALFGSEWTELRQAYAAVCRRVVEDGAAGESQMTSMLLRTFLVVKGRGRESGPAWGTEPFESSAVATVLHPAVLEMLEAQVLFLFSCFNAAAEREQARIDRRSAFADKTWTGYVDLASIHAPLVGLLYNEDLNLDTNVRGQDLIHRIGSPSDTAVTLSTRLLVRYNHGVDDEELADVEMFRESRESRLLFRLMMDYFRLHPHARDGLSLAVFRNQDIQSVIAAVHQYVNTLADKRDGRYYVLSPERRKPYALSVTMFTETGDDAGVARWIEQWRERWEAAETETKFEAYRRCRFSVAHRIVEARQLLGFQRLINDSFEADIAVLYDFVTAGGGGNRFAEVTPFDVTGRTLKFPILDKSCCAIRHPTDSYKRSRVVTNRQFTLGTLHAQVMHRLKNQGVQPGKEFVVLGIGDFAPWRPVVDALHSKAEWVICIDPCMDDRLVRKPAGAGAKEREIIGFGSGVGSHGEANYTVSTEQFSLADVQARLAAAVREVYGAANWSADDWQAVASGVLREARQLSGLSMVRATGVGHYIRDFMAYALTRKMLLEEGDAAM